MRVPRCRAVVVPVLDVGPWNVDDPYWKSDGHPASGLSDNDYVDWRFVHRDYVALPRS